MPGIGAFEERYAGAPTSVVQLPEEDEAGGGDNDDDADLKKKITKKITSFFSRG